MGRGKQNMELIANEKSRKITFQKRKNGMLKKCYEFSTLCGIDVCMIMYGPEDGNGRPREVATWPTNKDDVARIIKRYQAQTMSKPPKRVFSLSDIFMDRKKKVDKEISKLRQAYYADKYPIPEDFINSLSEDQLGVLLGQLDAKIEESEKMNEIKKEQQVLMKNALAINGGSHRGGLNFWNNNINNVHELFQDIKPVSLNPLMDQMEQLPLQLLLDQMKQLPLQMALPRFDSNLAAMNNSNINSTMFMNNNDHVGAGGGYQNGASSSSNITGCGYDQNGASPSSNIIDLNQHYNINPMYGPAGFGDPTVGMLGNMMFRNGSTVEMLGNNAGTSNINSNMMNGQYNCQMVQPMPLMKYPTVPGIPSQMNGSDAGTRYGDEILEFLTKNNMLF